VLAVIDARHRLASEPVKPPAAEYAVETRALVKTYAGRNGQPAVHALHGIDLQVPKGAFFGLLGPNGAGKSTLINILAGLVVRSGGTARIWGFDLDRDMRAARRAIGVVPQELNLDPFFTPRELLELQAGLYGVPKKQRRTADILEAVGLTRQADAYARSLSGGMRRRLLVAKAMVHAPPVLVLDEPTAGVDVELRRHLWAYVRELNRSGTTILLTTHYLEEAQALCDRIAIIDHGRMIACDTTEALLRRIDSKTMSVTIDRPVPSVPEALATRFNAQLPAANRLRFQYAPTQVHGGEIIAAIGAAGLGDGAGGYLSRFDRHPRGRRRGGTAPAGGTAERPGGRTGGGCSVRRVRLLATAAAAALLLLACAPMAVPAGPPVTAPVLEGDALQTADGTRLPLRAWLPESGPPDAAVIALHGFNDYSNFFDATGRFLAGRGVASYAYDQRGFGASPNRGLWPGSDALSADLRAAIAAVRARHPGTPLFLFGESMGGAVVMTLLARPDAPPVEGAVLSAPAVWGRASMPWYQTTVLWMAAHTLPWTRVTGRGLGIQASDNLEMLQTMGRDPMVIKGTRVDAVWGLVDLMDKAMAAAPVLNGRLLILYGERDQLIPAGAVEEMLARLPAEARKLRRFALYADGWHMLTRDLQAETVWRDIDAFIADPAGALPSGADARGEAGACSGRTVCAIVPRPHT
jgi:ABC-2 type transport system ATP-binding protein